MSLHNTKTEENLRKALAGESIARNKYDFFASVARANGDEDVAKAFEQMSKNEMMHAKFWFEQLYGKQTETADCLMLAAQGEYDEWHDMYPEFAAQARADGLDDLAIMFEKVAAIEQSHENRFMSLMLQMKRANKTESAKEAVKEAVEVAEERAKAKVKKQGYRCQFCGAVFENRPDICDVCEAIGSFDLVEYYV